VAGLSGFFHQQGFAAHLFGLAAWKAPPAKSVVPLLAPNWHLPEALW
jgi:hypothetical protein